MAAYFFFKLWPNLLYISFRSGNAHQLSFNKVSFWGILCGCNNYCFIISFTIRPSCRYTTYSATGIENKRFTCYLMHPFKSINSPFHDVYSFNRLEVRRTGVDENVEIATLRLRAQRIRPCTSSALFGRAIPIRS